MYRKEFRYDDVQCLKCGYVGLMSTGNCRKCYQGHKIHAD